MESTVGRCKMPLRDVKSLSDKQWEYLMKCLYSNEPEFVKMRERMKKTVEESLKRSKVLKRG